MHASSGMHERRAGDCTEVSAGCRGWNLRGASAKAEGVTVIILVDFENTHASGLEGYTYLNESDTLVMYYSDENSAVTKGVVDDLRKNGVHVRLVKLLKQHSNALDMYIASTTGMFLDSGEKICIVSKDHGYAAVRDFWHSLRGAEILLGETIKQCLLSSELNDEARIRLCKEREQKAMLVDAFTTMNTIPTRPTLSRSNQRRRRNDTRNFMEVSEPVAILPNPLMTETPADQLAKELSSAAAKSENTVRALQPDAVKPVDARGDQQNTDAADSRDPQKRSAARDAQTESAAQQETAMTASVSSDNASDVVAVTEAEASTAAGRGERGGRGRNGRNRRGDQNSRNDRNDRPEREDRNAQNRSDATAAEKTDSEQRTGRDADARTQNTRSAREQANNRRDQSSASEQSTTSEPVQERFGGYDGIMKMNEASRIALDQRQEQKGEQGESSAAKNRNHAKQNEASAEKSRRNGKSVNDEKQRASEGRKKDAQKNASADTKKDSAKDTSENATQNSAINAFENEAEDVRTGTALTQVKPETAALVKTEKKTAAVAKVDPNRVQFVWDPVTRSMKRVGGPVEEVNAESKDVEKTSDRITEKSAEADVKQAAAAEMAFVDAEKNLDAATSKTANVSGMTAVVESETAAEPTNDVVETVQDAVAAKDATAVEKIVADMTTEPSNTSDQLADTTEVKTADPAEQITGSMTETVDEAETSATDMTKSEKSEPAAMETRPAENVAVQHETAAEKAAPEAAVSGQTPVSDEKKPETAKKTGTHRKAKKATAVKKEADASEKPTDTKKAESPKKKTASKKTKAEKSPKNAAADVSADTTDAQPALEMTEEDIQLTKKKYSEGINTLHTYYVRLMKAFGREQGRAIYESTKKSVQEDIKARKAQLAAQPTTTEAEEN